MRVAMVFLVVYFLTTQRLVWSDDFSLEDEDVEKDKIEADRGTDEAENEINDLQKETEELEKESEESAKEAEETEKKPEVATKETEEKKEEEEGRQEDNYSFHKHSAPVSGPIRKVVVPSHPYRQGPNSLDYVGKPDYTFAYGVHDGKSKNSHTHVSSREGDAVKGEYRVLQPDGLVRIVRYTAHPRTGFQAHVSYVKY